MFFEHIMKKLSFVFEVFIEKPFGDPGFGGYFGNGDGCEASLFKEAAHRVDDFRFARWGGCVLFHIECKVKLI